jgi:hypothetical protein
MSSNDSNGNDLNSAINRDFDFDFNQAYEPAQVKFHTLRNVLASGACGALFEARRAMYSAPGGRFARCVAAGVNSMLIGSLFFGKRP